MVRGNLRPYNLRYGARQTGTEGLCAPFRFNSLPDMSIYKPGDFPTYIGLDYSSNRW